jgi:hypothetical protein
VCGEGSAQFEEYPIASHTDPIAHLPSRKSSNPTIISKPTATCKPDQQTPPQHANLINKPDRNMQT